jgi:hypothetical protein
MRKLLPTTLTALALGGLCVGCSRSVVRENKQIPDPLVMTRRPVEGKAHITEYRRASQSEIPTAPRPESTTTATPASTPAARLIGLQPVPEKGD